MRTAADVDGGVVVIAHCARVYPVQRVDRWILRAVYADGREVDLAPAAGFDCKAKAEQTIRQLCR